MKPNNLYGQDHSQSQLSLFRRIIRGEADAATYDLFVTETVRLAVHEYNHFVDKGRWTHQSDRESEFKDSLAVRLEKDLTKMCRAITPNYLLPHTSSTTAS